MEKSVNNEINVANHGSSISTTGTTAPSPTLSGIQYMNNSESSSQPKDAPLKFSKIPNRMNSIQFSIDFYLIEMFFFNVLANFESQSSSSSIKILPSTLPLINKKDKVVSCDSECQRDEKSLFDMGFKLNEVEGWEQIEQSRKQNLYKLLKNMIDNNIKPNVQIRIGDVTFNCHMMVLQCYSDFFMDCNKEVLIQLPEEKITPEAFTMVYEWMLSEEPLIQRESVVQLFNAATLLGIKGLIEQCWHCLDDDLYIREETAFLLYLEARKYHLENLSQLMLMRICKFFLTVVASKEFVMLTAEEVCSLLSSNTIGVNSEIEILMSAIRWLHYDWKERECHMLDLLKCVRFSLMPPWLLVTLTNTSECSEIDQIIKHPEVKKMINNGITYATAQIYYGEKRDEFLQLLESFQVLPPMQRQWVFDKECNYHHWLECPNMQIVTYKSFLEYLEMIQAIGKDYWHTLEMACDVNQSIRCCTINNRRKPVNLYLQN
uniref:BTB domain-containing protein n=1 Tax=Glossina brevipalpis TaxID=37001 RepID=A0A1A9WF16_9MUSC